MIRTSLVRPRHSWHRVPDPRWPQRGPRRGALGCSAGIEQGLLRCHRTVVHVDAGSRVRVELRHPAVRLLGFRSSIRLYIMLIGGCRLVLDHHCCQSTHLASVTPTGINDNVVHAQHPARYNGGRIFPCLLRYLRSTQRSVTPTLPMGYRRGWDRPVSLWRAAISFIETTDAAHKLTNTPVLCR